MRGGASSDTSFVSNLSAATERDSRPDGVKLSASAGPSNNLHRQRPEYPKDDALAIVEDIVVPDSKDPQADNGFEVFLALPVLKAPIVMAPAIELHGQSVGTAIEIHNIGPDGMLAAEFHTIESTISEQSPEDTLRKRGIAP
jgi:hypothetical protein